MKNASDHAKKSFDSAVAEADQRRKDEAEATAIAFMGGIGGGIVLITMTHYALQPTALRSIDLYIMVAGGLLDVTSDGLYVQP